MDTEQIIVNVDIYGSQYKLKGHSSVEYMKSIASSIDEIMHKLAKNFPVLDTHKLAVLTAVQISEEVFRLRRENNRLQAEEARLHITEKQLEDEKVKWQQLNEQYELYMKKSEQELEQLKRLHQQQLEEERSSLEARLDQERFQLTEEKEKLKASFNLERKQLEETHAEQLKIVIEKSEQLQASLEEVIKQLKQEHEEALVVLHKQYDEEKRIALVNQKSRFEAEIAKQKSEFDTLTAEKIIYSSNMMKRFNR